MSGGNNEKMLTVSRKLAKILTVSRKSHHPIETLPADRSVLQRNLDLTKCQRAGEIGSLYRGFVISKTSV